MYGYITLIRTCRRGGGEGVRQRNKRQSTDGCEPTEMHVCCVYMNPVGGWIDSCRYIVCGCVDVVSQVPETMRVLLREVRALSVFRSYKNVHLTIVHICIYICLFTYIIVYVWTCDVDTNVCPECIYIIYMYISQECICVDV